MTERLQAPRHAHIVDVAQWQPVDGPTTEREVAVGCSIASRETYGTGSSAPEGC